MYLDDSKPHYAPVIDAAANVLRAELPGQVQGVVVLAFEHDTFGYAVRGASDLQAAEIAGCLRKIADLIEEREPPWVASS